MRQCLRGDERAAFPVLEAILVAVLILTTILFFTSLQRPTTATDEGGIDLGRLASDTLGILQTKEFTRSGCPALATAKGLEEWVGASLDGTECVSDEVESFLSEVLPPGTQFLVRLDNGVEPLVLVPYGSDETPRAARAAETYLMPIWTAHADEVPAAAGFPGQEVPLAGTLRDFTLAAACTTVVSPTGSQLGPGGRTWTAIWQEEPGRVPSNAPFGTWKATCGGTDRFVGVGLPDGTLTDYPVYGLQLVVWFGA